MLFPLITQSINDKKAEVLYNLADTTFKAAITKTDFIKFIEGNIFPLGRIKDAHLISGDSGRYSYQLQFSDVSLTLMYVSQNGHTYRGIQFTPYKEKRREKQSVVISSNPMASPLDKEVDDIARTYIQQENTVGLCIGILKNGEDHIYGYGETARGNNTIPDGNSIFEIGSITKTFTASILAWYIGRGMISLSDPITKYLPAAIAANKHLKEIKIINLANHTSGLPSLPGNFEKFVVDQDDPYAAYTKEEFFESLKSVKLNTKPGEVYAYSNQGVALLGIILENISGKSFEAMVKEIITTPLKLTSTTQHNTTEENARFVCVYNDSGRQVKPWRFDAMAAAGCLHATINDLLVYADNNMHCPDTSLATAFKLTHQATFTGTETVALAWHIIKLGDFNYYWHNGGTGGSRSFLIFNPEKKIAVVLLSNSAQPVDDIALALMQKLN